MDWWLTLVVFFGALIVLLATGFPIAFCFLLLIMVCAYFLWGGMIGLRQVVLSIYAGVGSFVLSPLIMFILMGETLFQSGLAFKTISAIDKLLGRLPGRLGLVAICSGVLFASLSGSSVGSTAMLGTVLTPEMEKRGYGKILSLGTCMSSGGLAVIIPPSSLAVLVGAIASVSVGAILISGIIPGIFLAFIYAAYIIGLSILRPSVAPSYEIAKKISLSEQIVSIARDVLPFSLIIFAVIGCIFLGIATPTESAALGALASFILSVCYKKLTWDMVKKTITSTVRISAMIFMIIGGVLAFSQILAYTGATQGLSQYAIGFNLPPSTLVAFMLIVVLVLGCFMDGAAISMICIPIFMPIIKIIGYNQVLFCLLLLISLETGVLTPPFGVNLFVMRGIAPPDTTTADIYKAATPFVLFNIVALLIIMFVPPIALWLPGLMKTG